VEELTRTTDLAAIKAAPETERRARRSRLARSLPVGTCVVAALMLGTAAAVNGQFAAVLLAGWVALLAAGGWYACHPRAPRKVTLTVADLTVDGDVGMPRPLAIKPTRSAARVMRQRPRG
jgi:hypothetical protein